MTLFRPRVEWEGIHPPHSPPLVLGPKGTSLTFWVGIPHFLDHSYAPEYNLVLAKRRRCSASGKVTAGLAESSGSIPLGFMTDISHPGWLLNASVTRTRNRYWKPVPENLYRFSAGVSCESVYRFFRYRNLVQSRTVFYWKPVFTWPKWRVLICQTIAVRVGKIVI